MSPRNLFARVSVKKFSVTGLQKSDGGEGATTLKTTAAGQIKMSVLNGEWLLLPLYYREKEMYGVR